MHFAFFKSAQSRRAHSLRRRLGIPKKRPGAIGVTNTILWVPYPINKYSIIYPPSPILLIKAPVLSLFRLGSKVAVEGFGHEGS